MKVCLIYNIWNMKIYVTNQFAMYIICESLSHIQHLKYANSKGYWIRKSLLICSSIIESYQHVELFVFNKHTIFNSLVKIQKFRYEWTLNLNVISRKAELGWIQMVEISKVEFTESKLLGRNRLCGWIFDRATLAQVYPHSFFVLIFSFRQ